MKLPKKIDLVYSKRGIDPKMRGDSWHGYDEKKQIQLLVGKINEIIDFLERTVEIPNDTPIVAQIQEGQLIHQHDWTVTGRVLGKVFRECLVCGQQTIKPM